MTEKEKSMQSVLDKTVDGKKIFGTSFAIKENGASWIGLETITNKSYTENCNEFIIKPLGLSNTYLYHDSNDNPKTPYYKTGRRTT